MSEGGLIHVGAGQTIARLEAENRALREALTGLVRDVDGFASEVRFRMANPTNMPQEGYEHELERTDAYQWAVEIDEKRRPQVERARAALGADRECPACDGSGSVESAGAEMTGQPAYHECPDCGGAGALGADENGVGEAPAQ